MSAFVAARAIRTSLRAPRVLTRNFHSTLRRQDFFVDVNEEAFKKAIANKDKIVLVDFYADWCNPCKMLSPILEKITTDPDTRTGSGKSIDLVTVDTEIEGDLAQQYKVTSLPTVMAFQDGKPLDRFVGAVPEPQVRGFLEHL
ncbi:thioredoxin-like protein [Laetiporus sulphureus 93-53]|uniref:Thioredoxin-like protein n=1 Tax=Laetiporus sulphureus 93-53 TaxID=1314785 RepID=A0A165G1Y9_9APHY|nr:thioredoxin-like protein [Laetiporus sulphureus 93-53]KZT09720.1 thioredoxin-like protein [Laetiporus sulphureus 93-53]